MSDQLPESSAVAPPGEGGDGLKSIHLVVMGLTGAGKSTFVSTATGDPSVVVDAGILGGKYLLFQTRYPNQICLTQAPSYAGCPRVRPLPSGRRSPPHRYSRL